MCTASVKMTQRKFLQLISEEIIVRNSNARFTVAHGAEIGERFLGPGAALCAARSPDGMILLDHYALADLKDPVEIFKGFSDSSSRSEDNSWELQWAIPVVSAQELCMEIGFSYGAQALQDAAEVLSSNSWVDHATENTIGAIPAISGSSAAMIRFTSRCPEETRRFVRRLAGICPARIVIQTMNFSRRIDAIQAIQAMESPIGAIFLQAMRFDNFRMIYEGEFLTLDIGRDSEGEFQSEIRVMIGSPEEVIAFLRTSEEPSVWTLRLLGSSSISFRLY